MTRTVLLASLVSVALVLPARADDDDARKVIEKAVKAHGGEAALKKHPAAEFKGEGTATLFGLSCKYTTTTSYALPDKVRVTFDTTLADTKSSSVVVVNGDKVKQTLNGAPAPAGDAVKAAAATTAFKQLPAIQEACLYYPLLDKDKFTLKAEKEEMVDGKPAAVVTVTRKGLKDIRMFFDKESGLLVRYIRKGLDFDGKEVDEEVSVGEYKEFGGVQISTAHKVKHNGKEMMTLKVTDVKLLDKADPKLFSVE